MAAHRGQSLAARSGGEGIATALLATNLLGRWTRLTRGHVFLGSSCYCAGGGEGSRVQDLEQPLLDYLSEKHAASDAVQALLCAHAGHVRGRSGSVADLLRAIARRLPSTPVEAQAALLGDLAWSIDSFDELRSAHAG